MNMVAVRPVADWTDWFTALAGARRVVRVAAPDGELWAAVERLPQIEALFPAAAIEPSGPRLTGAESDASSRPEGAEASGRPEGPADEDEAVALLLRGHLECRGPSTVAALSAATALRGLPDRSRPRHARARGLRDLRPLHGARGRRGVVRATAARADPRLHQGPAQARDRAGHGARLHAVPASLAARRRRHQAGGPVRAGIGDRATPGLRTGRRRLGERRARHPGRRLPAGMARRALPVRPGLLGQALRQGPESSRGSGVVRAAGVVKGVGVVRGLGVVRGVGAGRVDRCRGRCRA